jgi:hypothetical protein
MKKHTVLLPNQIGNLLDYNPNTGLLFWKPRTPEMFKTSGRYMLKSKEEACEIWNNRFALKEAFKSMSTTVYKVSSIYGRQYYAHRVAFALMEGRWPKVIDHKNRDRSDNRWVNIRECSQSENTSNRNYVGTKSSKFRGVSKRNRMWLARCKGKDIGCFEKEYDAATAYNFVAFEEWGEFAQLNRA